MTNANGNATTATMASTASTSSTIPRQHYHRQQQQQQPLPDHSQSGRSYRSLRDRADKDKGDHSTSSGGLLSWSKSDLSLLLMMDGTTDDLSETLSGHGDDPHTIITAKNCTAAKRKQEARRKMQQHYDNQDYDDDNLSVYSSRTKAGGIADKQQRDNQKWKYCVELTLVLLGLSVTVATWIALSQAEEQHKQHQFAIAATQIRDGVETRAHRLRESLRVESQTITDLSLATEVEWPYYVPTSGSFQRQAEHVRDEANLQVLAVAPLVEVAQRDVWNRFVQFHYGRRTNSTTVPVYYYQDGKPTPYQPELEMTAVEVSKEVDSELEKDDEEAPQTKTLLSGHNHTGPFHAPLWLMSPFPAESSAVINYDILSSRDAQSLLQDMVMAQSAVISKVLDFSHLPRHAYPQDLDESQHTSYPHSLIFQPIYESYQTVIASAPEPETTDEELVYYNDSDATTTTTTTSFTTTTSTPPATTSTSNTAPVAILFGIMYWHSYLQDLLPPNSQPGIMAEFLNTCGQSIKYRLDGDDATFVGQDTASLSTYKDFEETGYPYYAIPFAQQPLPHGCQYTLFVYPTDDFYLGGGTSSAVLYTVLFAILFIAAAATVLFAIRRMQKGQHEAWSYAFEANNIIATLFPNSSFGFGGGGHHHDDDDDDDDPRRTSILTWMLNRHQQKAAQDDLDMEEFGGLKGMNISNHSRRAPKGDRRRIKKSLQQEQMEQFHESVGSLGIGSDDGKSTSGLVSVSGKGSISGLVSVSGKGSISSSKARRAYAKLKLRQQREKEEAKGKDQSWDDTPLGSRPIADLFPEATVLFADIVGFTAWSSSREPHHVFELLESIYHTFDDIARRRAVFKVDTVGDCYCCVTGVPIPRDDHAVIMAEFAREILVAFDVVTSTLEVQLGPETGDLCMRAGIHSGPVTAGVLRGDRSRFQIFGGTVSRTAKLEAEGEPGRIVISKETADLLAGAGKSTWFVQREKKVEAGGAALYTYWLDPRKDECEAIDLSRTGAHPALLRAANLIQRMDENCLIKTVHQRQVDWIVDQMEKLLKQVIIQRRQLEAAQEKQERNPDDGPTIIPQAGIAQSEVCVFDEVREVIAMPKYDALTALEIKETENIELSDDVLWQLHDFVTSISTMYRNNPFHNFEHASHVTMSVVKLLTRVVSPTDYTAQAQNVNSNDAGGSAAFRQSISKNKLELHDFSYGISSDPLTQFAVVFGALIHDVDHVGVSNAQLVKENDRLARIYKSQSVAEQNSVNIAWDLLMDPAFEALRRCIYTTPEEFDRFRATVINVVMATDIVDKDLKNLRNARWDKCFSKEDGEAWTKEDSDRKATIVLEHLIQASDISHTMQHWHVYQKWNHKLFRELYIAFIKGRMGANPAGFWYKGEIGFFDFYIIPLAKKLRDCGVFGVSCDEFLNYALENRAQWEKDGAAVVEKLINDVNNDKEIIALKEKYNFVEPEEEPKK